MISLDSPEFPPKVWGNPVINGVCRSHGAIGLAVGSAVEVYFYFAEGRFQTLWEYKDHIPMPAVETDTPIQGKVLKSSYYNGSTLELHCTDGTVVDMYYNDGAVNYTIREEIPQVVAVGSNLDVEASAD